MRLSDFDYQLPEELIAQEPPVERDAARMLVLDRAEGTFEDRHFRDLPSFLRDGDCLVLNDSRVLPSRLFGQKISAAPSRCSCLNRSRRIRANGALLCVPAAKSAPARPFASTMLSPPRSSPVANAASAPSAFSARKMSMPRSNVLAICLCRLTSSEPTVPSTANATRPSLQTNAVRRRPHRRPALHRRNSGSLPEAGARIARVTLHVGLGTFQPIDREDFENHAASLRTLLHLRRFMA